MTKPAPSAKPPRPLVSYHSSETHTDMPTQTLTFDNKDLNEIIRRHLNSQGLEPTGHIMVHASEPDRPWDASQISVTVTVQPGKRTSPPANLLDPRNGY